MTQPLFVTSCGPGRCGTTRMQLALSMLNGVKIAGQPTTLPLSVLRSTYEQMVSAGAAGMESNAGKGYQHHIGLNSAECLECVRGFAESVWFRGLLGSRVGAKLNGVCVNDDLLNRLWPCAHYIVCVRDPWSTWVSLRNSYSPLIQWVEFSETWADHVEAAIANTHSVIVRLEDKPQQAAKQITSIFTIDQIEIFTDRLTQRVHAADHSRPRLAYSPEQYSCSERFAGIANFIGYQVKNSVLKQGV